MTARAFADGMATLLASDAILQADITALLGYGVTRVQRAAQDWKTVPPDAWPTWMMEQGDGFAAALLNDGSDTEGLTIGSSRASFHSELDIVLLWSEPDRERAFNARAELPRILAQLLLRNPMPGGISHAWLKTWQSDQGINHPKQIFVATLHGEYAIHRS